jgi:hypothetical protein
MEINENSIIELNKKYGGSLLNKSNLEFDLDKARNEKNIYKSNAYILRGIVSGHCFIDGCKSTAIKVITDRFAKERIGCDKTKLANGVIRIAKGEIRDITKIEKGLRKWCMKL